MEDVVKIDCIAMAFEADEDDSMTYEKFVKVVDACERAQK